MKASSLVLDSSGENLWEEKSFGDVTPKVKQK